MSTPTGHAEPDWILSFINAAQTERERRENHTEDISRSVSEYMAAAERKIADAFGAMLESLIQQSSTGTASSATQQRLAHRTKNKPR
ncbi:hypothetical protein VTJ04DRAFT_7473 [Mycothermus thermophilus]|uniref:uncharacterized protein n=1 Tax=Humicola insolens TaxID=85995 RepID=UPI003743C94C